MDDIKGIIDANSYAVFQIYNNVDLSAVSKKKLFIVRFQMRM